MTNFASSNGAVVLTIPPNTKWQGNISLCATLAVTVGGQAATSFPSIDVVGAGSSWADGDKVAAVALFVPAVGVTAVTGSQTTASLNTGLIMVQTRANPINLVLNHGTGVTAIAVACGEFL